MSSSSNTSKHGMTMIPVNAHVAERLQQFAFQKQMSIDQLLDQLLDTYETSDQSSPNTTPPQIQTTTDDHEPFFANLLTMIPDAVISINLDEKIIIFNETAEVIFGYTREEVIGQPLSLLIAEQLQSVHHRHIKSFAGVESKPRLMATERSEIKGRRKDGQEFFMIASISRLEFGEDVILTAIVRDITEQKQAQEELHQQKQQYDELVTRIPAMVYRVHRNPQGNYHFDYVSPRVRDLNNVDPEDVLKDFNVLHDQTHPDDESEAIRLQEESAKNLTPFIWEGRVIIDGEIRWHHIESYPRLLDDGTVVWDGIKLDITEQKQAEQQARELELEREKVRILREFLEVVSHDLHTPISIINTGIYLLKLHLTTDDLLNRLSRIEYAAKSLGRIFAQMLKMLELDIVDNLEFTRIDVNYLLVQIVGEFKKLARAKNISFILENPTETLFINADKNHIIQALNNVIENALTYTPDDGTVIVRSFYRNQQVIIEVQDTGIGISENNLSNIFKRFYRVDTARNTSEGQNGLGLAIAEKIIAIHDGSITVDSQLDVGSTFRICLPGAT